MGIAKGAKRLYMIDVLDNAGNIDGTFSLSISRSYHGRVVREGGNEIDAVRYSAYASADAGAEWEGKGNAWVNVPGNGRAHDENPAGSVDIGGDGEPHGVTAYDFSLRAKDALNRSASASASLWQGGVSASARIDISGF